MQLLQELFGILTEKKKKKGITRTAAAAVYHRDYEKTKHKPYRDYDPEGRRRQRHSDD